MYSGNKYKRKGDRIKIYLTRFKQGWSQIIGSRLMTWVPARKRSLLISTMTGDDDLFRVMYVAKFPEAVYVLHCFKKKADTTTKHDKAVAAVRYSAW
jgi:phage-related protein